MSERHEVRLPAAWVAIAAATAVVAWAAAAVFGGRSTPWLGITVGVAVGLTLFAVGAWAQRVRLDGTTLSGNVLLRRSVDVGALTRVRVGGNPLPGGARSNDVAMLEDERGRRVTIPLRNFPAERRREIAGILAGPVGARRVELDDATRDFLEGG